MTSADRGVYFPLASCLSFREKKGKENTKTSAKPSSNRSAAFRGQRSPAGVHSERFIFLGKRARSTCAPVIEMSRRVSVCVCVCVFVCVWVRLKVCVCEVYEHLSAPACINKLESDTGRLLAPDLALRHLWVVIHSYIIPIWQPAQTAVC